MTGIDRRGFLLGTTALVKPALPAIEAVTSAVDVAGADYTAYWLTDGDFYALRSESEPESLFKVLRDSKYDGPIFKGEIGRWLGITFIEDDELRFERIEASDFYE